MKDYKKMYVINGCNVIQSEFDNILDSFINLDVLPDRFSTESYNIHTVDVKQCIDGFEVYIETYYFNYFGKFIEIGQVITSKKLK